MEYKVGDKVFIVGDIEDEAVVTQVNSFRNDGTVETYYTLSVVVADYEKALKSREDYEREDAWNAEHGVWKCQ